jgi:hypothetical protein
MDCTEEDGSLEWQGGILKGKRPKVDNLHSLVLLEKAQSPYFRDSIALLLLVRSGFSTTPSTGKREAFSASNEACVPSGVQNASLKKKRKKDAASKPHR